MADRTFFVIDENSGDLIPLKLIDNGDGSYSISTSGTSEGGVSSEITAPLGRKADNASVSVALSTEDVAFLDQLEGHLDGVETLLETLGTQATLAAVLAKIIAAPSTEAKQDTQITSLASIIAALAGSLISVGNVAHDDVDSGNPIKIGGKANSAPPTSVTTGDRVDAWYSIRGASVISGGANSNAGDAENARGFHNADGSSYPLYIANAIFNGSTWDRQRNVAALTLLASAARTADTNSSDQTNYNSRGILIQVNVSSAGSGSITPNLQVKDSISGNYKTIWAAATPLTANGLYVYEIYPSELSVASFTEVVQAVLSARTFRVGTVHNNANSITYSISGDMLL